MIRFNTLSSRLTFWYSTTSTLIITILFTVFYFAFDARLMEEIDDDLEEDISEYQQILQEDGIKGIEAEITRENKEVGESENAFIRILDKAGNVFYSTDLEHWPGLTNNQQLLHRMLTTEEPILYSFELTGRDDAARALYAKLNDDLILHTAESTEEKQDLMELLFVVIAAMFLIALPLAAYIGWLMAPKGHSRN